MNNSSSFLFVLCFCWIRTSEQEHVVVGSAEDPLNGRRARGPRTRAAAAAAADVIRRRRRNGRQRRHGSIPQLSTVIGHEDGLRLALVPVWRDAYKRRIA